MVFRFSGTLETKEKKTSLSWFYPHQDTQRPLVMEGVINAVAPNPVKMVEFSKTLGLTLGRPSLLPDPSPILRLILGDGAQVVLEGQHVKSTSLKKLSFVFKYPYLTKALAASTNPINH